MHYNIFINDLLSSSISSNFIIKSLLSHIEHLILNGFLMTLYLQCIFKLLILPLAQPSFRRQLHPVSSGCTRSLYTARSDDLAAHHLSKISYVLSQQRSHVRPYCKALSHLIPSTIELMYILWIINKYLNSHSF